MKKFQCLLGAIWLIFCMTACTTNDAEAGNTWQEQYDLGVRYLSEGNYEEAIIAFTTAIEIDPNRAEAYVGRGDAYVGSGETKETLAAAEGDYQAAIELDPTDPAVYLRLSELYILLGQYDAAINILHDALDTAGDSEEIQSKLKEIEAMSGAEENDRKRIEVPASTEGTLSLTDMRVIYETGGEITTYQGNEGAVGGIYFTFTVEGPPDIADVLIAGWFIDSPPSQQGLEEEIDMMLEIWKEDAWEMSADVTLPLEISTGHPVYPEDLGHTAYVVLVGIDRELNAVGYAVVEESIPQ